jgi:hypothetical protein
VCRFEQRCLVTLDLDFADTIRFQPVQGAGIAVIRLPRNPSLPLLEQLVRQFLEQLTYNFSHCERFSAQSQAQAQKRCPGGDKPRPYTVIANLGLCRAMLPRFKPICP